MEKENERGLTPPNKKRRLSLSCNKPLREVNASRFASPTKPDEFKRAAEGVVPNNTRQNTKWAVSTFLSWVEERNKRVPDQIDCDVLSSNNAERLSYVLRLFVIEARKMDCEKYPPGIVRNLLSGINRELIKNKAEFSIMDRSDRRFRELHLTLDSITSELHRTGVGVDKKNAEVISKDLEDLCWEKGSLGMSSPTVLQHTVFFYVGLQFVLRGVQEQHDLMVSQLTRVPIEYGIYSADVYYEYTEYISKNNLHRFTDSKAKNKVVRTYARPDSDCCLVRLLDMYICLLPPGSDYFYMRPCKSFPVNPSQPAYCRQRVGINQLKKFVQTITCEAGVSGYTNHSLRATAMTRMFNQGVPEKVIADKSGHRSLDGLRAYEHPSHNLEKAAGEVIADPTRSFEDIKQEKQLAVEDVKQKPIDILQQLPGFSGLNNCTINFNVTYGK